MRIRDEKILWWLEIARTIAKESHDSETKVGAILINYNTGAILATGYNGFVRSAPDEILPTTRPDKYKYIVHAEQNLICNCARHGISMNSCIVVCTMSPCEMCMRLLWQCGIKEVFCESLYRDVESLIKAKDFDVSISDLTSNKGRYYRISYLEREGLSDLQNKDL